MNKIITGSIAILVVIVLITSLVIPVVENGMGSMTVEERTDILNEGTPVVMGNPVSEYNIQWDSALPGMVKVNGNVKTVYFVAGADATVSPSSKNVTTDLTYGELPTPVRTGYTFDGWFTSTQYTTEVTEDTVVTGNNDESLYAKWVANEYTVTFDPGDGTVSPATKTVAFGQPYGELPEPEYTGHNFAGWFDSNDNPISSATVVSIAENHTLDAEYTLGQYLVSFTTDGNGTVDVQNVTVDYGTSYTISGNTIVIDGTTVTATGTGSYSFDSWTPSTSGTVSGAMTFIANFVLPPVTITFTAQSPGTVDVASYSDVPRNTQYTVTDNTVTITGFGTVTASLPNGYYMTGWNVAQGVGTISDAMTFTAEYEVIEIAGICCSDQTTWVVTEDGKLFGCDSSDNGQQGDGTTTDVTTFTQRLDNETIANVVCSNGTTWVVTTDGKLFGCGNNTVGQQGLSNTITTSVKSFTQRLDTETVASVVCSSSTTWVVTTDGKLFGCGDNTYGNQGNGGTSAVMTFTQRLDTETVASVVCSDSTTWVITEDGKLFGCGRNHKGQQGDGTTTDVKSFTQRLDTETVASVVCSPSTTWVVTTDGKLFGCGDNQYGQQGDGTTTNVTTFTQRGPPGSVNISVVIQPLNIPNIPNLNPFSPAILPMSVTSIDIVGTDYTWHAGGSDWMLCTVSTGVDQYALALFYESNVLLWDEDVTLTFSNGTVSGTNNGSPFSMTYTEIFYKGNGDYLLMSESAYVESDSVIIGYAIPATGSGIIASGDVGSMTALSVGDTLTVGDVSVTSESTDYDGISTVSEVSVAYGTDSSAVCSSVIVPNKVTIIETTNFDMIDGVLSAIPIFMLLVVIIMMGAIIVVKKMN